MPEGEILATAEKALKLDPNLAEAHAARGVSLATAGKRDEAVGAFERALELEPNSFDAHMFYARYRLNEGSFEKARDLLIRAVEIQPDDFQAPLFLFTVFRSFGQREESERYGRLGLKRAEEALRQFPESTRATQLGAPVLVEFGERERAKEWLAHTLAIDPEDDNARYNAACTYALLGEKEKALDLLEAWARNVSPELRQWFTHDSDLDTLRDHPRFQSMLKLIEADA